MPISRSRVVHATIASISIVPLLLTVVTGMVYRICRQWFSMEKTQVHWLMEVHEMSIIGMQGLYPILVGGLFCVMLGTGLNMSKLRSTLFGRCCPGANGRLPLFPSVWSIHSVHVLLARLFCIPIAATVLSGLLYVLARSWFSAPKEYYKWLMKIHQGSWIMQPALYVFILGTATVTLIVTGALQTKFISKKLREWRQDHHRYAQLTREITDDAFEMEGMNPDTPGMGLYSGTLGAEFDLGLEDTLDGVNLNEDDGLLDGGI